MVMLHEKLILVVFMVYMKGEIDDVDDLYVVLYYFCLIYAIVSTNNNPNFKLVDLAKNISLP
jgi:hypothetical protein